ncbi:cell division protein SepF [Methanocaldococcus sp.]
MIRKIKEWLEKKRKEEKIKKTNPESIEKYLEEIVEINATAEEDNRVVIKVCKIYDEKDAVEALLLVESGNIVIAKIPNLEKEADDEFFELIEKMDNEVKKYNGALLILGDEFLLLTPHYVSVEKHRSLEGEQL